MRVAIIYGEGPFPGNVRVDREARLLKDAGNVVSIFCRSRSGEARREVLEGLSIYRCRPSPLVRKFNTAILRLSDYGRAPFWQRRLREFTAEFNPDIVQVYGLELARLALGLARVRGVPLILDMPEYYSELPSAEKRSLTERVCNSRSKIRRVQWIAMHEADAVLVEGNEVAEDFRKEFPGARDSYTVISNTVDLDEFLPGSGDIPEGDPNSPRHILIYVGAIQERRGIQTVMEALPFLRTRFEDVTLQVVGRGPYVSQLKTLADELEIGEMVRFEDWVEHKRIPFYLAGSAIGVIPLLRSTKQTDLSVPNKLFEYMAMGKPVLASDCRAMGRIVVETECGLVFEAGNPRDFAEKAGTLLGDPMLRQEMGGRGRRAVENEYNWRVDGERLLQLYSELVAQGGQ